ncbi:hypothetical protein Tco_0928975, partial [Tanacetum coccineum]
MKPEYQAVCEQKRINRSKMEEPHVTGTKSFARLAEEEVIANDSTNTQGKMISLSNNDASSSTSSQTVKQRLAQTKDVLYTLVNIWKDPTANSNLFDVLRSMNIE